MKTEYGDKCCETKSSRLFVVITTAVSLASQKPKSLIWNDKFRYTNNDDNDGDDDADDDHSICDEIQMNVSFFEVLFFKWSEGQLIVENSVFRAYKCVRVRSTPKQVM